MQMEPQQHLNAQKIYNNGVQFIYMYGLEKQQKRKRSGQIEYTTDEERKDTFQRSQTTYMLNKELYCDVCKNGNNYLLAGKQKYIKGKKHQHNISD